MDKKKAKKETKPGRLYLLTRDNDPRNHGKDYDLSKRRGHPRWQREPGRNRGYWFFSPGEHVAELCDVDFHREFPRLKLPPGGGPIKVRVTIERDE